MTGRVIEIEYAKGWGRVELADGRVMTFDTSACIQGIPDVDARVMVSLVPARLGGEKVGRLVVDEAWVEVPGELPYLVDVTDGVVIIRNGAVEQASTRGDNKRPVGEVGYATLETRVGLVGHSQAWMGSSNGVNARDQRLRTLQPSTIRAAELAACAAYVDSLIDELRHDADEADAAGDDGPEVTFVREELARYTKLAKKLAAHAKRTPAS